MGESNALFMSASLWSELDGFDEIFDRPGGGLVNHDLFRRACELPDVELVVLLGEGTFHQFHGGAATGGQALRDELWGEYERLRGMNISEFEQFCDQVGNVAARRGLTEAKLAEILEE